MPGRLIRIVPLACALLLALTALGCAESAEAPEQTTQESSEAAEETLTQDELAAWGMSVSDKQTRFAEGFSWQAPVIDGEVVAAEVDTAGTHFYRIEVDHSAEQAAEWYRRSYPNANWIVLDERTTEDGGVTTTVLEVTKGQGAWSRVLIEGDDSSAIVEASVGVGSPPEGVF